ncbi:TetR/AcrR family transcriptional regulator [Granulicella arctica]|uniref:AcrR family transcriptional regulator n=1 Tax=Granulicella arctica TaxID=940613 RepID=A0A7Y9TFL3_9BACT|nr:TetR/AcrR family transcriptional regulator [Granulicella arctica]NYF77740.1 AcrR family transcriptional regulator [Granulicella arctica]
MTSKIDDVRSPQAPPRAKSINKHQAKTEATLNDLLDAAEKIFVRDGFERAQLETIAAEAGRTKGAVYAHFKGKEDLFLALFERQVRSRMAAMRSWPDAMSTEERILAGREEFINSVSDSHHWPILTLEFKLFALRNTVSLERTKEIYRLLFGDLDQALPWTRKPSEAPENEDLLILALLRSIPSAIAMEQHFIPILESPHMVKKTMALAYNSLFAWKNPAIAELLTHKSPVKQSRSSKKSKE